MALKNFHVFVYGTLKRKQPNHHWLNEVSNGQATFVENGKTLRQYPLIIATKYNIPFLLPESGIGHYVTGEVYEVDEKMLSRLDTLEDHPNYYERRLDLVRTDTDKQMKCWIYFLKDYRKELLDLTMFQTYDSKGNHGMPYYVKADRDPNYDYITPVKITKEEDQTL